MIIKSISLNNIRSYASPEPIQLTTGVTLFEGDIGSGKSTILSAVEFALFGLGEIDGPYLLRHGARTGSVLLAFEVNGKEYKVYRSLERKRTNISQKEGYIVEDGLRTDYSVTEMKIRILEILNFNEIPRPKTSSLIYRYAIFTPQEMMKEVLFQPVERRLETLRRAFEIEDYSIVNNNASIMLTWLENESKILERQTQDITDKRILLEKEQKKIEEDTGYLARILEEFNVLNENRQQIAAEIEALQSKKELVQRLQAEIPLMQKALQEKVELLKENRERCKRLTDDLSEIANAEKLLITIGPMHEEYEAKKAKLDQLEPSIIEIQELTNKKSQQTTAIEREKTHLEKAIRELESTLTAEKEKICKQKIATLKIPEMSETETRLSKEVEELPTVSDLLASLSQENSATKQDVKNKRERVRELKDELAELRKIGIGAPCPKCKQELTQAHYSKVEQDYLNEIENLEGKVTDLSSKAEEIDAEIVDNSAKEKTLKDAEKKLNKLRPELAKLKQQEETLKEDEENFGKKQGVLEENQKSLSQEDYAQNERNQLAETLAKLEELSPVQNEYETTKGRIKALEKMKAQEQYLTAKEKASKKGKVTEELTENQNKVEALDNEVKGRKELIEQKQNEYDQEKSVLQKLKDLDAKKEDFDRKLQGKNGELVGKRKDIQRSEEESKRIAGEIQTMEDQLLKLQELNQYQLWLSELFIPAVKLIETNVLANINSEFNSLFQKWLSHLLEGGDITVRVDENFTPIIEQNGYEMEVDSLSGGEKTSVALAYRLALNVMVKKVCEAMQSNLLILDEPTDGFSREQLFRLRDILSELKCEQVIAVSHESELEGFVDKIYRITKEAGESKITAA